MKRHKPAFGSISTGTLRPEDLAPAFADELRALRGSLPRDLAADMRKHDAGKLDADDLCEVVDELQDALNEYAPAYGYFGAHPGDGADFGFWLSETWQEQARDDGALIVADLSEVPKNYRGNVLHVNDHGNAALYSCRSGARLSEVWSIV